MYSSGASIVSCTTRVISRARARFCSSVRPSRMSHWMMGIGSSQAAERNDPPYPWSLRGSSRREERAPALAPRGVAHLRRRPVLDEATVVEDPHARGGGASECHLMGDDEHRHSAVREVA